MIKEKTPGQLAAEANLKDAKKFEKDADSKSEEFRRLYKGENDSLSPAVIPLYSALGDYYRAAESYAGAHKFKQSVRAYEKAVDLLNDVNIDSFQSDKYRYKAGLEKYKNIRMGNVERYLEKRKQRKSNLEKTVSSLSIISFLMGIFFLSPIITGNAISNLNINLTYKIGLIFTLLGPLCYFLFKKLVL